MYPEPTSHASATPSPPSPFPAPPPQEFSVPTTRRRFDWKRFLLLCGAIGLIASGGIGMLLYLGFSYGLGATIVGLIGAILPVPILVSVFVWLDRFQPEPWKYLAFCFGWGACVATALALAVNTGASVALRVSGESDTHVATLVAPFIEEIGKAIGPLLLYFFRRRIFNGPIDGIVYFGLSAIGFAMMENILYMGGVYLQGSAMTGLAAVGALNVVVLFIVRVILTGFAHPLFTVMTGIAVGFAARSNNRLVRWLLPLSGLLVAMMLHGTWNLMATLGQFSAWVLLYGYFGLMIPIFYAVVGLTLWLRTGDSRIIARVLPTYVDAAWIS
ncbi:MAG: PrsW family intramembrane metalloprotease, partial [Longispora sp.]|nr:PrsW family intramembrane metalloprotease [Longispora sp. (in: high G+C Gram-positive bacteria)]